MHLKDTYQDFEYLNNLPGKKILLKGNHDYWWNSVKSMKEFLVQNDFNNIEFLHNNSYEYEGHIIAGTRGWSNIGTNNASLDEKVLKREVLRLELSIQDGIKNNVGADDHVCHDNQYKDIIVCMHYPPFIRENEKISTNFIDIMKKYNVKRCLYGHLHGVSHKDVIEGNIDGIEFKCLSCDYTDFKLIEI